MLPPVKAAIIIKGETNEIRTCQRFAAAQGIAVADT